MNIKQLIVLIIMLSLVLYIFYGILNGYDIGQPTKVDNNWYLLQLQMKLFLSCIYTIPIILVSCLLLIIFRTRRNKSTYENIINIRQSLVLVITVVLTFILCGLSSNEIKTRGGGAASTWCDCYTWYGRCYSAAWYQIYLEHKDPQLIYYLGQYKLYLIILALFIGGLLIYKLKDDERVTIANAVKASWIGTTNKARTLWIKTREFLGRFIEW